MQSFIRKKTLFKCTSQSEKFYTKVLIIIFSLIKFDKQNIYTGQIKFQIISCILKLNATVWQQKLNIEDSEG